MDIEKLRNFCLSMEGVTEKTPFGKFARRFDSILVFYVCDHMFCMVDMEDFNYVSFRSTPEEIDTIMADYVSAGVPANPGMKYWVEAGLNGDFSDKDIYFFVRKAYDIIKAKYSKKKK